MFDLGLMLTSRAIRRQLAAMPCELYLIRLIHSLTKRPFPGERLWTATQLASLATIRFLRVRNREGCDVYVHPYAEDRNAGYILIDLDHADPAVLSAMCANGHEPCVVLQTSPGHRQAWVQVSSSPWPPALATAVGRHLAHLYGGDRASTDWRHLGRLAGFINQKLSRRSRGGYGPWVQIVHAKAGVAPQAGALVESAMQRWRPLWLATDSSHPSQSGIPSMDPYAAPTITLDQATAIYQDCLQRWRIAQRFSPPDWSIVDFWVARHLLSQGIPAPEVEAILQLGSPQFPRRHGNPQDYLHRTMARAAFPPRKAPVSVPPTLYRRVKR